MAGWRPMHAADLPAVVAIADAVHLDHPEAPEVFADRLALFAPGCFLAEDEAGRPLGYCIAHPGIIGAPPPLDTVLGRVEGADCLYIHDVCLLPTARGQGLAAAIARRLDQVARDHGFARLALTAVNGSDGFWQALGYEPRPCAKVASYGDATYRVKSL